MKATLPLCLLLLWSCTGGLFAQKSQQIDLHAGMALHAIQDLGQSPFMYTGSGLMYGAAYSSEQANRISGLHFSFGKADLQMQMENEPAIVTNTAARSTARAGYHHLRKLPVEKLDIFVGGELFGFYDFVPFSHAANNLVSYELTFSVSPMVMLAYEISSHFKLGFQASTPLASFSMRPLDNGFFPLKDFDIDAAGIIENGRFASLNNILALNTRTTLTISPKEAKSFTLFYAYNGGVNRVMERKGFATQTFGLEIPIGL